MKWNTSSTGKAVVPDCSGHANGSARSRIGHRDRRERHRRCTARRKRNLLRFNLPSVDFENRACSNAAISLPRNSRCDDRTVDTIASLTRDIDASQKRIGCC